MGSNKWRLGFFSGAIKWVIQKNNSFNFISPNYVQQICSSSI